MTIIESIILGAVQGLTEFLPISSSGHLVLFQKLFSINEPPIFFDTLIHVATLLAIIIYLRKEILYILKTLKNIDTIKLVLLIVLATLPAVLVGLFLQDKIDQIFNSLALVAVCFFITSAILFATYFFKNESKDLKNINWLDALFIGVFQALAILPGVSRSGATISASIFRNFKREDAFKFSFLLAIPVISGAFVLQFAKQGFNLLNGSPIVNLLGFVFAFIFGILSLNIIEKVLIKGKLHYFAVYCFLLGALILIFAR